MLDREEAAPWYKGRMALLVADSSIELRLPPSPIGPHGALQNRANSWLPNQEIESSLNASAIILCQLMSYLRAQSMEFSFPNHLQQ